MPSIHQLLIAGLAMVACGGCFRSAGPELAPVTGTVTLNGKPLDRATIMFQPASGRPSFGTSDTDGKYSMRYTIERLGVMPGSNIVSITSVVENDQGERVRGELLPRKYHSQTELRAEVEAKMNVFDFQLNSK